MPEIKNTFLKGRMNKDLDDRLIPEGEYIDALNVQITKSDGSNVGVIHNIKGNSKEASVYPAGSGHKVIGSFFDDKNNRVFWFITNNISHYIYMHDIDSGITNTLVSGSFLKFNTESKITGINVLEDLLLWTDNYNQPRKITISRAIANPLYYNSEIKLSVAKYAPYLAPIITGAENDPEIKSKRIEEEFVRFGYRYKFKDQEYSILSPFTPIVFKMESNVIDTTSNFYQTSDLRQIGASTELSSMVNNINKVTMRIPLPNNPKEDYEIEKIDVLYKESDSTAIRVIETINVSSSNTSGYEEYIYKSTNFKATLPEDQLTRVYDNVPYKALAQEVAGNRVIYGNITINNDLPNISFRVINSEKQTDNEALSYHSVKQRRIYEIGIVLSDIFGRTSPVITSPYSTIYVGAKDSDFDNSTFNGDSLKIVFENITDLDADNGIFEGSQNLQNKLSDLGSRDPEDTFNAFYDRIIKQKTLYDPVTNITGWYSYKVVVKQKEQEYYNAYVPGVFHYNGLKSYFVIHGDNINKLPRTSENRDDQDAFSSSQVRVYPKVLNVSSGIGETFENSYRNSDFDLLDITDIGNLNEYNLDKTSKIYEPTKNHLIGKIPNILGTLQESLISGGDFACFETEPFESTLDIYYETPTSGLISDIVLDDVELASTNRISLSKTSLVTTFTISEDTVAGTKISDIYARDSNGNTISGYLTTFTITSEATTFGVRFNEGDGYWELYLKEPFRATAVSANVSVGVSLTFLGDSYATNGLTATLTNVKPLISLSATNITFPLEDASNNNTESEVSGKVTENSLILKIYATNGSAKRDDNKLGLTFSGRLREITNPESPTEWVDLEANPGYGEYVEILDNQDYDPEQADGTVSSNGVALFNYYDTFSPSTANHVFELEFTATESVGSTNSDPVYATITVVGNAPEQFPANTVYYANFDEFSTPYEACQSPIITNGPWTAVRPYYSGDDPFVVAVPATGVYPNRMYQNSTLSIQSQSGWYKRTDTGLVGYYHYTYPDGWFIDPVACSSLSSTNQGGVVTSNPRDTSTTDDSTDDGTNPYETVGDAPTGGTP